METKLELIDIDQAQKGDVVMIPDLTTGTQLTICELEDVYATNFKVKGVTGFCTKPASGTMVVRISTKIHPLRIELIGKR